MRKVFPKLQLGPGQESVPRLSQRMFISCHLVSRSWVVGPRSIKCSSAASDNVLKCQKVPQSLEVGEKSVLKIWCPGEVSVPQFHAGDRVMTG